MNVRSVVGTSMLLGAVACSAATGTDEPASSSESSALTCATAVDASRSLFVTDPTALGKFGFKRVMDAIIATGSTAPQTSLALYQQWWDTNNDDASGVSPANAHCDDNGGTVDGFPIDCPRQEGLLARTNPFVAGKDHYSPVAVVNRFDLAPKNGASCGQYRVVFAKDSGKTDFADRNFVIFEAVLPNPTPASGIAGCVPVAKFWDDLSADADATSRATKLSTFFFSGLPGFAPVVHASHYGIGGGTNTGQIRANQFMPGRSPLGQGWQLREYRLSRPCTAAGCKVVASLATDKTNPFFRLFSGTDVRSSNFQTAFLNQVPKLARNDINAITMSDLGAFNAGQSDEQLSTNQYETVTSAAFKARIQTKLTSIGSTLTPSQLLARATTQSCAGCHQLEANRPIGGGLTWPGTNGFVQIDERSTMSPALATTFLPHRKKVLEAFVEASCTHAVLATDDDSTIGGTSVGASN